MSFSKDGCSAHGRKVEEESRVLRTLRACSAHGRKVDGTAPSRLLPATFGTAPSLKLPPSNKGKARDQAGKDFGVSGKSVDAAKITT